MTNRVPWLIHLVNTCNAHSRVTGKMFHLVVVLKLIAIIVILMIMRFIGNAKYGRQFLVCTLGQAAFMKLGIIKSCGLGGLWILTVIDEVWSMKCLWCIAFIFFMLAYNRNLSYSFIFMCNNMALLKVMLLNDRSMFLDRHYTRNCSALLIWMVMLPLGQCIVRLKVQFLHYFKSFWIQNLSHIIFKKSEQESVPLMLNEAHIVNAVLSCPFLFFLP